MAINGQLLQQAGQGDAYVLPAFSADKITERLDHAEAVKSAKAAAEAKAKQERDKRLDELMKWNPAQAWYPHTEQTNTAIKNVYDTMTEIRKSGTDPTPEQLNMLNKAKWDAEVLSKKSNDIKALYPQLKEEIEKSDKYTDKAYLNSRLNDEIFSQPDVNKIDFDKLGTLSADPRAFKHGEWVKDFADTLPEQIESIFGKMSIDGGDLIVDKEVKSKFFDLDANGNVRYDKNGKPAVKISDETIELALQDPRYAYHVQQELSKPDAKYKTPGEIVKNELSTFAKREEKKSYVKGYSDKEKENDAVKISTTYDQVRNFNMAGRSQVDKSKHVTAGWIPEVKSLYLKKDKVVKIDSPVLIDANTNKTIQNVGSKDFSGLELQLLPVNPENGHYLYGPKENALSNPKYIYKWVLAGSTNEGTESRPKIKDYIIPYEHVRPQMKAAYGIDLDERDPSDPSEVTDLELISQIKQQHPEATAEERLKIFKLIRAQKE